MRDFAGSSVRKMKTYRRLVVLCRPRSAYGPGMSPMNIRYDQRIAIAFVVIGPLLLLSSLATSQMIGVAGGAILALLGILMFVNPMLRIESTEVQVRSPV